MSAISDVFDRISGVAALNSRITDLYLLLNETRQIVIRQQTDIAELKGQLKAMIQMQSMADKRLKPEKK